MTLASGLAHTVHQEQLIRQAARTLADAGTAAWPTLPSPVTPVMLQVLQGTGLLLRDVQVSAVRSPRAVLLAYLHRNNGEDVHEIVAHLLPPDTVFKRSEDQSRSGRAVRVGNTSTRRAP